MAGLRASLRQSNTQPNGGGLRAKMRATQPSAAPSVSSPTLTDPQINALQQRDFDRRVAINTEHKTPLDQSRYNVVGQNFLPRYKEDKPLPAIGKDIVNYGLGTVGRIFSAPQQALMQTNRATVNAITGKPQDFSEMSFGRDIIGKETPVTQGLGMVLDPANITGLGVVGDLAKAGMIGKAARLNTTEGLLNRATNQSKLKLNNAINQTSPEYLKGPAEVIESQKKPSVIYAAENYRPLALPAPAKQEPFTQVKYSTMREPKPPMQPTTDNPLLQSIRSNLSLGSTPGEVARQTGANMVNMARKDLNLNATRQVGEGIASSKTILPTNKKPYILNENNIDRPFVEVRPRTLQEKQLLYGGLPETSTQKMRIASKPESFAQSGVSKFKTNTLTNADWLQGDAKKVVHDMDATYGVKTDKATIEKVNQQLAADFEGTVNRIKQNGLQSKEDSIAAGIIGRQLREQAKTTGDYTQLSDWLQTVRPEVTNVAQTLQGLSTWKSATAEGALMKAQQVVDGVNKELEKINPKAFKNGERAVLTNNDIKFISNQMDKVESMPDGYMKDMEFAKVKQMIADKIPASFHDKFRGLQRLSLLLNPKTLLTRNPGGNIILGAAENIKDMPGAVIDAATTGVRNLYRKAKGLDTIGRTTAFNPLPKVIDQAKGFGQGVADTAKDAWFGVDTSPTRGMMELPQGRIFKSPVLNALDQVERKLLQLGDRPFYQAAYNSRIGELQKLRKVTEPTEEMIQEAKLYALDRVFQGNSELAKRAGKIRDALGIVGDLVMPFTQTPANVLNKLIDYSPGGFIKGMVQLGKNAKTGVFDQKLFVDRLARSLTGTGLIAVGYTMAKNGMLTGGAPKNTDAANMEKSLGKSPYAFKVGDQYFTYDWAQPTSGLIAAGADAYFAGKGKQDILSQMGAGAEAAGNTILNQSFLQGLLNMFSNYGANPVGGFVNTMMKSPTQAAPTALNQVRQFVDPFQRETYNPNPLLKSANAVINRVPGLSATLPKKIDVMGNEVKNFQGNNNVWNVLFSPGFTTKYAPNDTQSEIMRLYNQSGQNSQIPTAAPKSIKWQGQDYQLTPQEFTQYQTTLGQQTMAVYNDVMAKPEYQAASDTDKGKMLTQAIQDAKDNATYEVLQGRGLAHNPLILSMPTKLTVRKKPISLTPDQQSQLADTILEQQNKLFGRYQNTEAYKKDPIKYDKLIKQKARDRGEALFKQTLK